MPRKKPDEDIIDYEPLPPPAKTLEGREEQLIAAAMDLVEKRIAQGTASAQETVHFLRLGSVQSQLQNEKLRNENGLLKSRVKDLESRASSEGMYEEALRAFKGYAGLELIENEDDGYEEY